MGIEEKINYSQVEKLPAWQSILISAAGLISNGLLATISLLAITRCKKPVSILFWFTFAFFNISDWVNYLTIRTIFLRGDTANMVKYGFIIGAYSESGRGFFGSVKLFNMATST